MSALLVAARGEPPRDEAADTLKTTEALLHVRLHGLHPQSGLDSPKVAAAAGRGFDKVFPPKDDDRGA